MTGLSWERQEALSLMHAQPWTGGPCRFDGREFVPDQAVWHVRPWRWLSDGHVVEWVAYALAEITDGTGWGCSWSGRVDRVTGDIVWPPGAPLPPDEWVEEARRLIVGQRRPDLPSPDPWHHHRTGEGVTA